jgi:hypothetical protein
MCLTPFRGRTYPYWLMTNAIRQCVFHASNQGRFVYLVPPWPVGLNKNKGSAPDERVLWHGGFPVFLRQINIIQLGFADAVR